MVPGIERYVAEKGSVALNGVSLTVATVAADSFEVALIPETLSRTNLGDLRKGHDVNVEVDLLARYLERQLRST
jgi:riboflavin synthase